MLLLMPVAGSNRQKLSAVASAVEAIFSDTGGYVTDRADL
jgi:hypothetical protein